MSAGADKKPASPLFEVRCPACMQDFGGYTALESVVLLFEHLKEKKDVDAAHFEEWKWGQQVLKNLPKGDVCPG